jgi:hypothetical protein
MRGRSRDLAIHTLHEHMFVMRGMARTKSDIDLALALVEMGLSDYEVARRTGIPRGTVLNWRRGRIPGTPASDDACSVCHGPVHAELPPAAYSYLLAQYLGDGSVFHTGKLGRGLRISSDAQYPGIIEECCEAICALRGRRPHLRRHSDRRLVSITSYWKSWPCLLPQHGRGRKHNRTIALAPWQVELVETEPGQFLRGLIHSDGWRGLNRVHVKGRDYAYPRYQFSNRSDDIRTLFTYACELVGVAWRPWGKFHISVARRDAVELLDRFVGPKY